MKEKAKKFPLRIGLGFYPKQYEIGGVKYQVKSVFSDESKNLRDRVKRIVCTDFAHLTNDEKGDILYAKELVLTADERRKNGSQ